MGEATRPYTVDRLAERWECSAATVRALVSSGRLRAMRVGRLIRVRPEWVEEFECGGRPTRTDEDVALERLRAMRKSAG